MTGETEGMQSGTTHGATDYWSPEFEIERREDGSILLMQKGGLAGCLPTLDDYLEKLADSVSERTWIAMREDGGGWQRTTYGETRATARALGATLPDLGLGPHLPLIIL